MRREVLIGIAIEIIGNGTGVGLQLSGIVNPVVGWIVLGISNVVGLLLIGYGLGKSDKTSSPVAQSAVALGKPKKRLDSHNNIALFDIVAHMERVHGHADEEAMISDIKSGVLVSDLLKGDCARCGKPRNQKGDYVS